jgi:hypothetical protein
MALIFGGGDLPSCFRFQAPSTPYTRTPIHTYHTHTIHTHTIHTHTSTPYTRTPIRDALDGVLQNDGLLDVVQQLSHALEEAAKTEDEMRLVNAAMHRNEKDQTAEMAQLQGAVAIQRNATLSTKWMLSREKVPPVPAPLLILSTVERLCRDLGVDEC